MRRLEDEGMEMEMEMDCGVLGSWDMGYGEGVDDAPLFLSPFLTNIDMSVGLGNGIGFVT